MEALIRDLRSFYPYFNPPCNQMQLDLLALLLNTVNLRDTATGKPILGSHFDGLFALYRDHNGMPIGGDLPTFPARLMSYEEAAAQNILLSNLDYFDQTEAVFWSDDDSNFIGLHLESPLAGMVFFWDHEDPTKIPRYRSTANFLRALLEAARHNRDVSDEDEDDPITYFFQMPTDFPKLRPDSEHDSADLAAAQIYIERYKQETDLKKRRQHAFIAMNLLPFDSREPLVMFADDHDMHVQAKAIELFGLRRDTAAIPQITRLVLSAFGTNPRLAGIGALAAIQTPESQAALLQIASQLLPGYAYHLTAALKTFGVDLQIHTQIRYRLNPDTPWTDLPA